MGQIRLIAFGIAKDIVGAREKEYQISEHTDIAKLKSDLVEEYPPFKQLVNFSIAVNEVYRADDFELNEGDEVVIIPPVSGG